MAGDQILSRIGAELTGAERSYRGNESINNYRSACGSTAQKCTAHSRNVKATYFCQYIDHIGFIGFVQCNGSLNDLLLF